MEIISTYIQEHNLGGRPCHCLAGSAQQAKIEDGRHKYIIHITFFTVSLNYMCDIWFLMVFCIPSPFMAEFH